MTSPYANRTTARAVVYRDGKLLIMERWFKDKNGKVHNYYSVPGGGIDPGETGEEAVVRELQEEMAVEIKPIRLLTDQVMPDGCHHHYYWCEYISGTPVLQADSGEASWDESINKFEPKWIAAEKVTPERVHFEYAPFVKYLSEIIKMGGFMPASDASEV